MEELSQVCSQSNADEVSVNNSENEKLDSGYIPDHNNPVLSIQLDSTRPQIEGIAIGQILHKLRGFKLAHLNIASIPKHLDQLRVLMVNKPVDILSINESRLDGNILNNVNIPGYNIYRNDRSRRGGGVALYIRDVFDIINRTNEVPSYLEAVFIEIKKPKSKPVLILSVYRPPNSGAVFMEYFKSYLQILDNEEK